MKKLFGAWLITAGIAAVALGLGPAGEVVGGLILLTWGAIIGLNRKAAGAMPDRLLGRKWTPARYRQTFALVGIVGLAALATGLNGLVT